MSDSIRRTRATVSGENPDFTQSIRKLTLPTTSAAPVVDSDTERGTALLICRDGESRKWGPRWLRQAGIDANLVTNRAEALGVAVSDNPDVIIVEASYCDPSGTPLYTVLQNDDRVTGPIIALCSNSKEMFAALNAGVFDVVRKPFEWQPFKVF